MIIIDGADCTGKTTLAKKFCEAMKGQYFHCSYAKDWNMETYHRLMLHTAGKLEQSANIPCVIDRWALSEAAYGKVFRNGPSYDIKALIKEATKAYNPLFILATTKAAIKQHEISKQTRNEMFDDVEPVLNKFDELVLEDGYGNYIPYDYEKTDVDEFVKTVVEK